MSWEKYAYEPHPVYRTITQEDAKLILKEKDGEKKLREALQARGTKIGLERNDPYNHGYEPFHWKDAEELVEKNDAILISGGNRSGKTEFCAKFCIKKLLEKPDTRIVAFHTTHQSSLQTQQPVLYKYLPSELKGRKIRSTIANVSYTQKNGFTESTFIMPNRSQLWCMHYSQDPRTVEGLELDYCWADELIPKALLDTIRFRLVTRSGKLLLSFTPIEGMTPVVKDFVSGGEVTEWADSELLPGVNMAAGPKGKMPYIMRGHKEKTAAIWFFTLFNPYNPYKELVKRISGAHSSDIKIRAYGWADSSVGNAFPRFGDDHIINHADIPTGGQNFMVTDPAGSRNWFFLWARAVDGRVYFYREWPDYSMGEWSLPGAKLDGQPGPAQRAGGGANSIAEYKRIILDLEQGEPIFQRLIDPRAGRAKSMDGREIMDELKLGEDGLWFDQASGAKIEEGVTLINDMLYFDQHKPMLDDNKPRMFVSDACKNLIYSLREWTGADKEHGASKDPIDCCRYVIQEENLLVSTDMVGSKGGGAY